MIVGDGRSSESDEALIDHYSRAAAAHSRATLEGDPKTANKNHDVIAAVYRELRQRGVESQRRLLALFGHRDAGVRQWAAAHALEFAPAEGERVLEEIAALAGRAGFDAKMILREWRAGRLRFP